MKMNTVVSLIKQFESSGIDIWIDGGWGVDALLGKQTRPHNDLDIVVQQKDVSELRKILSKQGYKEAKKDDTREWNFVLGNNRGEEIDVHVVKLDASGNGIYGPEKNNEVYPADSLRAKGVIAGKKVRCLSADYQIKSHLGYKTGEKDIKDVTALSNMFGIDLPKEYLKRDQSKG